jgi:hypothetical protein
MGTPECKAGERPYEFRKHRFSGMTINPQYERKQPHDEKKAVFIIEQ